MLNELPISELLCILDGQLLQTSVHLTCTLLSTDTRTLQPGQCFIALQGDQYDGHNFIQDAIQKQAAVIVVEKDCVIPQNCPSAVIRVHSTITALERCSSWYAQHFTTSKIAITGSMGKTTTKELTAHILSSFFSTLRTPKSFNNNIGIPLTLLELHEDHQFAVLEVGGNHLGEIEHLSCIISPDVAVITCIAPCHLEGFGSLAGVERAKSEILKGLKPNGLLITNGDDPACCRIAEKFIGNKILFGLRHGDILAKNIVSTPKHLEFDLLCSHHVTYLSKNISSQNNIPNSYIVNNKNLPQYTPNTTTHFHIPISGRHNILNILPAIAVSRYFGLSNEQIQHTLHEVNLPKMRLEVLEINEITLINDAYNANPKAMIAALEFLQEYFQHRRIAVLGTMRELGTETAYWHHWLGTQIIGKADYLIAIGQEAEYIIKGAIQSGFSGQCIKYFLEPESATGAILDILKQGDVVLFKASRKLELDKMYKKISDRLAKH